MSGFPEPRATSSTALISSTAATPSTPATASTSVPASTPVTGAVAVADPPAPPAEADPGSAGTPGRACPDAASVPLPPATRFPAAFAAVYRGQLARARVCRIPLLFVAAFQSVGILVLLRGIVDTDEPDTAAAVVAGSTVLVVAFVALNLLAQRFGALRAASAFDYYLTLPVPGSAVVLGTAASYATFAVPGTIVTALVGVLLYDLPLAGLWLLLPVAVLAGACLAGIGAAIGLLAPRPELATVAGQLGMSVVLFLGVIPADRLPGAGRLARDLLPSSYAVDALVGGLTPAIPWGRVVADLAVCAAVALVALVVAVRALRRAVE